MNEPMKPGISLLAGYGFGWVAMIVAPVISWILLTLAAGALGESSVAFAMLVWLFLAFPLLAVTGLAIGFLVKGHKRAALGVLAAVLTMIGLLILLVAACFGLMTNWH